MDTDTYFSYTQALRHPVIIGHVAGWRLPWALSASQLGAVAAASGALLVTRPVWAHLGAVGNLAVFALGGGWFGVGGAALEGGGSLPVSWWRSVSPPCSCRRGAAAGSGMERRFRSLDPCPGSPGGSGGRTGPEGYGEVSDG